MNEHRVREVLRRLPRQEASADFAAKVLRRLDESEPSPLRSSPPGSATGLRRWALAAGLILAAGFALTLFFLSEGTDPETPAPEASSPFFGAVAAVPGEDLSRLRREHRQLLREVQEMRRLVEGGEPVLYLGGNGSYDLFLPLEGREAKSFPRAGPQYQRQPLRVLPTSWQSY